MTTEELRKSYRPDVIKVLFVGESPPVGGAFFYAGNNGVLREFRKVFGKIDLSDVEFLSWFKASGCYLDDLVYLPINYAASRVRKEARTKGIGPLANRVSDYRPVVVIAFMRAIDRHVRAAVERSGIEAAYHCVPFPGFGQQGRFQDGMAKIVGGLPLAR